MKAFLALSALFISMFASAEIVKTPCTTADYEKINAAISSLPITSGKSLKTKVQGVLMQEMGPVCNSVMDTIPRMGIPGRRSQVFELTTAGRTYTVVIGRQVEAKPLQWVSLRQEKARE